jgi:hypothetical protein
MCWINAWWVITMMEYARPFLDRTNPKPIGYSMRPLVLSINAKVPISMPVFRGCPKPASVSFPNTGKKLTLDGTILHPTVPHVWFEWQRKLFATVNTCFVDTFLHPHTLRETG